MPRVTHAALETIAVGCARAQPAPSRSVSLGPPVARGLSRIWIMQKASQRAPPCAQTASSACLARAPVAVASVGSSLLVRPNEIFRSEPTISALACNKWPSGGNSRRGSARLRGRKLTHPIPQAAISPAPARPSPLIALGGLMSPIAGRTLLPPPPYAPFLFFALFHFNGELYCGPLHASRRVACAQRARCSGWAR